MAQVNRYIEGNKALDQVDHALGRPFRPFNTYRDHFATDDPRQAAEFRASPWWREGITRDDMTFFHVSDAGRQALADELANVQKYGRLFVVTSGRYEGCALVMAKSRSQAKYRAYMDADLEMPFMEFCKEIRVRLDA